MNLQDTETNLSFLLATLTWNDIILTAISMDSTMKGYATPAHQRSTPSTSVLARTRASRPSSSKRGALVLQNVGGTATRKQEISKASFVASSVQPLFKTGPRPSMNICFLLDWWSVLMSKLCVSLLRINCWFTKRVSDPREKESMPFSVWWDGNFCWMKGNFGMLWCKIQANIAM